MEELKQHALAAGELDQQDGQEGHDYAAHDLLSMAAALEHGDESPFPSALEYGPAPSVAYQISLRSPISSRCVFLETYQALLRFYESGPFSTTLAESVCATVFQGFVFCSADTAETVAEG